MTRPIIDEIIDAMLFNERRHSFCGEKSRASSQDGFDYRNPFALHGFGANGRRSPEASGEARAASRFPRIG